MCGSLNNPWKLVRYLVRAGMEREDRVGQGGEILPRKGK